MALVRCLHCGFKKRVRREDVDRLCCPRCGSSKFLVRYVVVNDFPYPGVGAGQLHLDRLGLCLF